MKQKQLSKYAKQQLAIWGIHICPRPDIFDNRNREITVVIDESCGDTVIFEDALTIRTTTENVEKLVDAIAENVNVNFTCAFFNAINSYGHVFRVFMKKSSGVRWWKEAIERVDFVMEMYGIDINAFTALDYQKCCRHLGGKTAFYRFIHDAVCYEFDDYPICFVCQNCRTNRHGERHCTTCFVPVGETSSSTKTLKLSDDYPISSDIIDLVEAMPHNECSSFIPRTNELGTKIVDWLDKMREKV